MSSARNLPTLVLVALLPACAKEAPSQPPETEIRKVLAQQEDAWNRHDAKAWVAAFSDDAEFINILGTSLQGRAEIERRHAEIFRTIFSHSHVSVQTRKVRALGSGAALAETDYQLRDYDRLPPGIRPTDPDGTLRTRLKYVWELRPEGWRIVSAQNTAILPSPPPALAAPPAQLAPPPVAPPG
ncbi:MAG TPA: SgcJ/EcaC family oxidoreductase [Polyangiaceae bacterium]|nr:SgcJ/EcaC family oxidoreductase [Polyangiaceae bacterium]